MGEDAPLEILLLPMQSQSLGSDPNVHLFPRGHATPLLHYSPGVCCEIVFISSVECDWPHLKAFNPSVSLDDT